MFLCIHQFQIGVSNRYRVKKINLVNHCFVLFRFTVYFCYIVVYLMQPITATKTHAEENHCTI